MKCEHQCIEGSTEFYVPGLALLGVTWSKGTTIFEKVMPCVSGKTQLG